MTTHQPGQDVELINEYRGGADHAAETLFRLYYESALVLARSKVQSKELGEELASDAFLKVLEIIRRGKGPKDNFRAYLLVTVRHNIASWYQDSQRVVSVDDVEPYLTETAPESSRELEQTDNATITAFNRLPDRWRQIIFLKAIENRSPKECARLLGMNATAVGVLYLRARAGLRREYLREKSFAAAQGALSECVALSHDLGDKAAGITLRAGKARGLTDHLATCPQCGKTLDHLTLIAHTFGSHSSAALASVAGLLIIPTLPQGSAVSAAAGTSFLARIFGSSTGIAGAGAVGVTAVLATGALTSQASSVPVEVAVIEQATGSCLVELDQRDRGAAIGTLATVNSGTEGCSVVVSRDGRTLASVADIDQRHVFIASRPGTYQVTIAMGGTQETRLFSVAAG
ncbi:RNA polymerase sigma factor [Lysinibacter cavernae]|uniref:RNA polymerase sigma factor (Sigma-70 family) n=1 Tax=Lysinibacter cavernae TaxID=1640652 RepID=A0A7X5R4V0_9MICO|nr:sigma-70 family RNA polymerase sigma factor [Lysinibacter cavernae]NIH55340.1 RNA polymerase sigma factor (sigma-70 family) [Lysinibacter cavernae]